MSVDTARLSSFLSAVGPRLRPRSNPAPAEFNSRRLGRVVEVLQPHLERARANGGFLNVWAAAGLRRDEIRNAAVLASLLTPHRLGSVSRAFLAGILSEVGPDNPEFGTIDVTQPYSVLTEACPLGARETRVDILLEGPSFILGIEVKIDALERLNQLTDYRRILQAKGRHLNKRALLIFLSPRPPKVLPEGVAHLTWRKVARAATKVAHMSPGASEVGSLLQQFSTHVHTFR